MPDIQQSASSNNLLSGVIGQQSATTVLSNALESGRLAGSYLFVGPNGVGKATTALRFAAILAGARTENDAAYKRVVDGVHPDVRVVRPGGKSNTIHVGQLWPRGENKDHPADQAILRDMHFEPIAGPKRVFIIDGAEGLRGTNEVAGNSILKTLEEPPPYAHFILTAEALAGLMPTVVSRCQVVRFGLSPASDIETTLVQRFGVDPERAHFLAVYSEGRLGHAVVLARSTALMAAREELLDLAERSLTGRPVQAFRLAEELRKIAPKLKAEIDSGDGEDKEVGSRDAMLRALEMLAFFYRDLAAVCAAGGDTAGIVNIDRRNALVKLAQDRSVESVIRQVDQILGIRTAIERNAYQQTALEVLFTQLMCHV